MEKIEMWSSPRELTVQCRKGVQIPLRMRTWQCLKRVKVLGDYKVRLLSQKGRAYDSCSGHGRAKV